MDGELVALDALTFAGFADEPLGEHRRLAVRQHPADHVPAVNVEDHVQVEVGPLLRAGMRFVPKAEREAWHGKAMDAAERADLGSLIELWLEKKEIERLVERLRKASDAELEALSHYATEPAAKRLAMSHPDVAARAYRAMGMRILNAKKSKYYDAALSNFENAKRCYERSGLGREWDAVVAAVRRAHHRKVGFMGDFERLVAGNGPSQEPSFLDRARSRWSSRGLP